jgi:SAM-dependent methyltransferase
MTTPTPAGTSARPPTPAAPYDWAGARGEKWRATLAGMEAMLAPIDEPLIRALQLDAPFRIADLACGGGGTTLELLRRAPAGSVVHGFDISPALVESARARVSSDQREIAFAVADVATGPAPDAPYDRLISRFGVMFFADPPAAFANLVRWLAPGGRFAFAVWGRPADNPWHSNVRAAAAEVIAMPASDPEAPGPFRYAEADKLLPLLERAGLGDLEVRDWRGALAIGGGLPAAEAARFALASSSVSELLTSAGAEALDQGHRALTARFARHEQGGAVRLDASVHLVTGARLPGPRAGR